MTLVWTLDGIEVQRQTLRIGHGPYQRTWGTRALKGARTVAVQVLDATGEAVPATGERRMGSQSSRNAFWELVIDIGVTSAERPLNFVTRAEVLAANLRARGLRDVTDALVCDLLGRAASDCPDFSCGASPWEMTAC